MANLVILPGVNSGAYLFKGVQGLFPALSVHVLNPPGVAGTPLPVPFTAAGYAQQATEYILDKKLKNVTLMGHSMGGYAAQEVAHLAPEAIERLVLVSTSPGQPYTSYDVDALQKRTGQTFWHFMRQIEEDPEQGMRILFGPSWPVQNPQGYKAFLAERIKNLPGKAATMAQITAGAAFSSARWLPSLGTPTLVVHGAADHFVSPQSGQALAKLIRGSQYLELFGVGHFPMIEHADFYRYVGMFLAGQPVGQRLEDETMFTSLAERFKRFLNFHG